MINSKIDKFARAITIAEGWLPEKESASYRRHNPGNLRWSIFQLGTKNGFAYFLNDSVGFFALCYDLARKCRFRGSLKLGPTANIEELIQIYTAEKDPTALENFIRIVERITGKARDTKLSYFIEDIHA